MLTMCRGEISKGINVARANTQRFSKSNIFAQQYGDQTGSL